jgi:hypothetical protein
VIDWIDRMEREPEPVDDIDLVEGEDVRPAGTGVDDFVDEFVEFFNARDLEGLAGMLAEDVDAELVHALGSVGAIEGLEELFVREPLVILTRGEVGQEPIAAVWHPSDSGYAGVGYLVFDFDDAEPPAISRIDYVDEIDDEGLLVEEPDELSADEWELTDELDENV